MVELADYLNVDSSTISKSIERNCQTKGFVIKIYNGDIENITPYNKRLTTTKINQYDVNGNFIKTWNSIEELANNLKCNPKTIIKCCTNKQKTLHKKYRFKYYNGNQNNLLIENDIHPNSKRVGKFNKLGNLLEVYNSANDAIKNFKNTGLYNCFQGKIKTCGGFIWKYI